MHHCDIFTVVQFEIADVLFGLGPTLSGGKVFLFLFFFLFSYLGPTNSISDNY